MTRINAARIRARRTSEFRIRLDLVVGAAKVQDAPQAGPQRGRLAPFLKGAATYTLNATVAERRSALSCVKW